jgi:hypothetical protein
VTVRVINGKAESLPRQPVFVQFFYEKPAKISTPLNMDTDFHGEAQFKIPELAPEYVNVRVTRSSDLWHCACGVMVETQAVLHRGIVQIPPSKVPNAPFAPANAEPGQIVFVVRPFTGFEKWLYPFLKQ